MMSGKSRVLVVSPHPDDAELGMGAVIHKLARNGTSVDIAVVVGQGDLTMLHSKVAIPFEERVEEQRRAARHLKVGTVSFLDVGPASKLDAQPLADLVSKLDALLPGYTTLVFPMNSFNQDHQYTYKACLAATRPGKADHLEVLMYEQPVQFHGEQSCNQLQGRLYVKVDLEDVDAQIRACGEHKSQLVSHSASIYGAAGVINAAQRHGLEVGTPYACVLYPLRMYA